MFDFKIAIPTEIYFGEGVENRAGELMHEYADQVLLLYGSERLFQSGTGDKIVASLNRAGCRVATLGGVKPNTDSDFIDEAIRFARSCSIRGILAVGGGSVIDSAKAIAAGVCTPESVIDLYKGETDPGIILPIGTVVTMPASGSEANGVSVIRDSSTGLKHTRTIPGTIPKFALLNPELTCSIPARQTAAGGFDIFSHAFERFMDKRRGSLLLDELTAGLMRAVTKSLPKVIADPEDLDARGEILYAATVAHSNMLGPGGDFACHAMSHVMTHAFGTSHGEGLAMLIPAWCRVMKQYDEPRILEFYSMVFGVGTIEEGEAALAAFIDVIGLDRDICRMYGQPAALQAEELAEMTLNRGPAGAGFRPMSKEDLTAVYQLILRDNTGL